LIESDKNVLGDYAGLLALTPMYCTGEKFIKYDHEIRIQKIGDHVRALKRRSSNWKGNVGNTAIVEVTDMKSYWKDWIMWTSEEFGGLDICAMDVLVTKDGVEHILEINDTAIGLMNKLLEEDSERMRDVVLAKMKKMF
jgi:glutathione synthase/RimK-type ligase-like ATP-grasp enzyme